MEKAEEAARFIQASEDESAFRKNVWLSGAYLRIVTMLLKDDPKKAKEYFQKAEEIINSDKRLVLRKGQLEKLKRAL